MGPLRTGAVAPAGYLETGGHPMPNPSGLCKCGCGARTTIAPATNAKRGHIRGEPVDYIRGHSSKKYLRTWDISSELPFCACGCSGRVTLSKITDSKRGRIQGEPNLFLRGHWNRPLLTCEKEDRGYDTLCCIWQGQIDQLGYPRREVPGFSTVLVHRQVYIAAHGEPPAGFHVHHLCEQRDCVRLEHLEAREKSAHLRSHYGITPEKYVAIHDAIRSGGESQAAMARRFGVSTVFIWRLRKALSS